MTHAPSRIRDRLSCLMGCAVARGMVWRRLAVAASLLAVSGAAGCVHTVISGEDPNTSRPTATGDDTRDMLVVELPWMEAPIPRLLLEGKPVVAERVSARTPDQKTSYFLRTRSGVTAEVEIGTEYPKDGVVEFTYQIKKLPPGFALDVPVGLGRVGRRGPIALSVNGAPFNAPASADVAIVNLARDDKTRIRCTRIPDPPGTAAPATGASAPGVTTATAQPVARAAPAAAKPTK